MEDIPKRIDPTLSRLLDRFRLFIRALHLAYATEKTYATARGIRTEEPSCQERL